MRVAQAMTQTATGHRGGRWFTVQVPAQVLESPDVVEIR
jgi:hypothetical protein